MRFMRGFSLVELSIVLVILGLLTGGILTGQSLIRAAELRAVTTEFQRYQSATNTFRDKYFALPGDMRNATDFWGIAAGSTGNDTTCFTASGTGTATCNGDGNGIIDQASRNEMYRYWEQLANAGLIEGTYSGITGPGHASSHVVPGENAPVSKLSPGGWMVWGSNDYAGDAEWFAGQYGNNLSIGAPQSNFWTHDPLMRAEEAWNIDTKMDDGRAGTGSVWALHWDTCTDAATNGSTTITDKTNASYILTDESIQCALVFTNTF